MTLEEFVQQKMVEYNKPAEWKDAIIRDIVDTARQKQHNNYACLTDDEVAEIVRKTAKIVKGVSAEKEEKPVEIKPIEPPKSNSKPKAVNKNWDMEALF